MPLKNVSALFFLLGAACCGGHLDIVKFLLENKANPSLQNNIGTSSVWLAAGYGHTKVLQLLLETEIGQAQINVPNKSGDSPLLGAVSREHKDVVNLLLKAKADATLTNQQLDTALTCAANKGNRDIVDALLEACPSASKAVKHKNSKGTFSLALAAAGDHYETLRLLLEKGQADLLEKDANGATALSLAAFCGHERCVEAMLYSGVDAQDQAKKEGKKKASKEEGDEDPPRAHGSCNEKLRDETDKTGATALWLAASKGRESCVKLLLAAGADPTVPNNKGETPEAVAQANGYEKVVELLQKSQVPQKQ